MPAGWFEQNKLAIAKIHEQWLLRIAEPENHLVIPEIANDVNPRLANWKSSPCDFFVNLLLPAVGSSARKYAREQISVDLARTAIALERYRLAHAEFSESLDALAPQFIAKVPHDVIGGGPLKYRRTNDGQFVLYSVGWNEKDDGGAVVLSGPFAKSGNVDFNKGDWVWCYPTK
jgi:hypothetical protein